MALSKSLPTPITQEPARVVVRLAVGAPLREFPVPVAPIAPEPFVPLESTPAKLITVMEEPTLLERVAVTVTLLSVCVAKARQISDVPL
jgi:hypothetical protein